MIKAVLFDCDGVLVDSYESTIEYLQNTFLHFNLQAPPKESFIPLLGTKTPDIIRILQPQLSDEEFEKVYRYSMEQSLLVTAKISLMPGVTKIIQTLSKEHALGVVSNRGKDSLNKILNLHNLSDFFKITLAREDVVHQKPDPEPIFKALNMLDVTNLDAIFIGDTAIDAAAAKSADVACIIYNNPDKSLGDYQITNLEEIPSLLTSL